MLLIYSNSHLHLLFLISNILAASISDHLSGERTLSFSTLTSRSTSLTPGMIAELQREADFFGEQRIKILDKYGSADENGNYTFEGDNEQKAITELDELLDLEVEPVIEPLNILITEDLKLSVNDIGLLEAFIHFIDET